MKCGLLGEKLGHSYSPQIHAYLGSYAYSLFEKSPEALEGFLRSNIFDGINVTIPYKKAVIPYCSALSPEAKALKAVNTIVRQPDGSLWGHNTDYFGFSYMLTKTGLDVQGKKVLVLGSGGASNTVYAVLQAQKANPVVISRSGENHYGNLYLHRDAALIVNTTPVGMYPETQASPLDLTQFPNLEGVLDIIYNPARTKLLMDAEKLGLKAENGLWMLVAQAKESAEYFTGTKIDNDVIDRIYRALSRQMENLVLIGMPGVGKSTVGKELASLLDKTFVDADKEIIALAGKSIPEIFTQDGEDAFRRLESRVLQDLGQRSGLIIATGGGCVTREENYQALHQNGKIFWLKRDIGSLSRKGRPLSQGADLERMYIIRKPLYAHFADYAVNMGDTAKETAGIIQAILYKEKSL